MLFGLYTAAAGMLARSRAQDVTAHNLANISVPGFKRQTPVVQSFDAALQHTMGVNPRRAAPPQAGALRLDAVTDYTQGQLRQTGNAGDLAIDGDGYFVVSTPAGPRLTRAGAFHVNPQGMLATGDGHPLLDDRDQAIIPAADTWTVGDDGNISVGGWPLGKLRIAVPSGALVRDGHGYLRSDGFGPAPAGSFAIRQGYLENGNADPIREMVSMIAGARAYEMAQRAITAQDETLGRLINEAAQT